MATTANNVSTGKPAVGGAVFCAPKGSTLPTSATGTLDTAFKGLGYVSEDGLTNSMSYDVENVKAWGGDTVATLENNKEDTFQFTLLETLNTDVLKAVYEDSNVTGSALSTGISVKANSVEHVAKAWVFDMIMKNNVLKRIVVPMAAITEIGEIVYKDDEAIGYEVTITALADTSGNYHYEYMQNAPTTPGSGST